MPEQADNLIAALQEKGLLSAEQAAQVLQVKKDKGVTVEEAIRQQRFVGAEQVAQTKAEMLGVPYIDLGKEEPDEEAMKDVSRKAATTYRFVAFSAKDGVLKVAMESPEDFQAREAINFIAKRKGLRADVYLAAAPAIEAALGGSAAVKEAIGGAIEEFSKELTDVKKQVQGKDDQDIGRLVEEAPVTKVVAVMIRHAIEGRASDIHVEPTDEGLHIRYRVDGALHTSLILPMKVHSAVISRIKILSNLKIDESRLPQDGRFSATVEKRVYDFRVSTMPTTHGEKVALRILDKSTGAPSFEDLGLRGPMQQTFEQSLRLPFGIILISGPTGAGKSTTIFSLLSEINSNDVNIVTLEDPVEYEATGINQTQTQPEIGLSFASGLRSILRQDPDIIMVGEIRDKETAQLAVHASLTGHLVLSTIHTNDAVGTVPRLVDMEIDPFLLAASLRMLAAQRLVSRMCQNCKREKPLPENVRENIKQELAGVPEPYFTTKNQLNPSVLYESPGCPECNEEGVKGRLGIFEAVPVTRAMRDIMNDSPEYDILREAAAKSGAITMRQDGILKALNGEVPYEDVLRATSEVESDSEHSN